jgi:transposase-like protein
MVSLENRNGRGDGSLGEPVATVTKVKRPDPEVPEKARRRRFSAAYKLRIVREADACGRDGELGALLRREGLYSSHLATWRRQRDEGALAGLAPRRRGRPAESPEAAESARLRRENEQLRRQLAVAETVIEVQKKLSALLGMALPAETGDAR